MSSEQITSLLSRAITQSNLSKSEIARQAGVSHQTVSNIEAGKGNYTLESATNVAKVLGLLLEVKRELGL